MLQSPPAAPFWKSAVVLWLLGMAGTGLILPYVMVLQQAALAAATARTHLSLVQLLLISTAQSAVLLVIAVVVGLWASRKLGLATPLLSAWLTDQPTPRDAGKTLLVAFVVGLGIGLVLVALDYIVFAPLPQLADLTKAATAEAARPGAWRGFLASFYGGLDEEILMRLGLMSLLALIFRAVIRRHGEPLSSGVFWTANILTAVLFGLGHLPATAALVPLTTAIVIRAIVLNGVAGIAFGALFRRYGLEWAMLSHFAADLVLHVVVS